MYFTLSANWNFFLANLSGIPHVNAVKSREALSVPVSPHFLVAINSEQHPSEKPVKGEKWGLGHCRGAWVTPDIYCTILTSAGAGFIQGVTQTWAVLHLLAVDEWKSTNNSSLEWKGNISISSAYH